MSVSARQRKFRVFLLTVGAFCLLCGIFVPWLGRKWLRADRQNAPVQETTGEIAFFAEPHDERGVHFGAQVLVRFAKGVAQVRDITDEESKQFVEKQKVRIFYRVGRTGRVYVDRIAPLTQEAKQ